VPLPFQDPAFMETAKARGFKIMEDAVLGEAPWL
jgi:hypothetical protein